MNRTPANVALDLSDAIVTTSPSDRPWLPHSWPFHPKTRCVTRQGWIFAGSPVTNDGSRPNARTDGESHHEATAASRDRFGRARGALIEPCPRTSLCTRSGPVSIPGARGHVARQPKRTMWVATRARNVLGHIWAFLGRRLDYSPGGSWTGSPSACLKGGAAVEHPEDAETVGR